MRRVSDEAGVAMLMALVALSVLSAIGVLVLLTSSSDVLIAGAFRDQRSGVYAADAIAARAIDEIGAAVDWSVLLSGTVSPLLADGLPYGTRALADGSTIDLQQIVNTANCQKSTACTIADLDAVTSGRPWGTRNPRWQLYAYGPLRSVLSSTGDDPPWYVALMVGDDPLQDHNVIALRAEAFGPRHAHAAVEILARRQAADGTDYNGEGPAAVIIESWREVR